MLPTFVSSADPSRKATSNIKTTPKKSSSGKENKPIKGNSQKRTQIPAPVKIYSKSLSEQKNKNLKPFTNKTNQDKAVKKKPLSQNGNTIAGNKTTPRVSVQDKTDRFEVDPAALQSIINGVSPMVSGKRERSTIGVPNSRRLVLGETNDSRMSFHVGYKNGSNLASYGTKTSMATFLKKPAAERGNFSKTDDSNKNTLQPATWNFTDMQNAGMQDFRAASKQLNKIGPIRRLNFHGMQRSKPYNVKQEKKGAHRKNGERKLTFEQRLSIIINSRPGLDGDRKTNSKTGKDLTANLSSYFSKLDEDGNISNKVGNAPLGDTTSKVLNKSTTGKATAGGTNDRIPSGRPTPKLPGQLCEFTYISPRKKDANQRSTDQAGGSQKSPGRARKSPCKTLAEIANGQVTNPQTPSKCFRFTPRKNSVLKEAPCRYTAEALYNLRNGLPLPPKEQRYEFVDVGKQRNATPKRGHENDTRHVTNFEVGSTDVRSSAKNKKSVRWADALERRKSDAHKQLNFDAAIESSNPSQQNLISSNRTTFAETLQVPSSGELKNFAGSTSSANTKTIPKPFANAPDKKALISDIEASDWDSTPDESKYNATNVPFAAPLDSLLARLRPMTKGTTPVTESSAHKLVPNCPAFRRTWARTPHAKEEEKRREKALLDNTMGEIAVSSTAVTSLCSLPSSSATSATVRVSNSAPSSFTSTSITSTFLQPSNGSKVVNEGEDEKSDFEIITERILQRKRCENLNPGLDELEANFDLSRGILQVIDDINKCSIKDDLKRVYARKFHIASPEFPSASSVRVKCSSDSNIYSALERQSSKKSHFSDSSSDNGLYYSRERTRHNPGSSSGSSHVASSLNRFDDPISSSMDATSSLAKYLSALPEPILSKANESRRVAGQNTSVVYSTAPIRANGVDSRGSPTEVDCSRPPSLPLHIAKQAYGNGYGSRKSSQSDISSGYFSQEETETRISALVHDFIQPVHKIIDNAFSNSKTLQNNLVQNGLASNASRIPHADHHSQLKQSEELSSARNSAFKHVPPKHHANFTDHQRSALLDAEVAFYTKYLEVAQRLGSRKIETRNLRDPVAKILSHGDCYHFVPIED